MKRYFWIILATFSVIIIAFTVAAWFLFSKTLEKVREVSEQRMVAAAELCSTYFDNMMFGEDQMAEIAEWIDQFASSTGFNNVIVCDSFGFVRWSSSQLYNRGEHYKDFYIDEKSFENSAMHGSYQFSPRVEVNGIPLKSIFYGCYINGDRHVIIIEADQNFFEEIEDFRYTVLTVVLILCCITLLLLGFIFYIERRARRLSEIARRNERLAFLGRTAAELAHEIKNPLGIMKASIDVLRMNHIDEKQKEATSIIQSVSEEIMRVSQIVSNILGFSKDQTLEKKPFHVKAEILNFVAAFQYRYPDIEVTIDVPESLQFIGDRIAFNQIIHNLMQNSANAFSAGAKSRQNHHAGTNPQEMKRITIAGMALENGLYSLTFTDNGPGVPRSLVKKIFDPFVSGLPNGTGLGLSIVKALCSAGGWKINLVGSIKGNTRFEITVGESMWVEC